MGWIPFLKQYLLGWPRLRSLYARLPMLWFAKGVEDAWRQRPKHQWLTSDVSHEAPGMNGWMVQPGFRWEWFTSLVGELINNYLKFEKTISDGKFPEILQPPPPVRPKERENYKRCWISLFAKRHFEGQVHLTIVSQLTPGKGVIFGKVPFLVKFTSSFLNNCFTEQHGSIHAFFSSLVSLVQNYPLPLWIWYDFGSFQNGPDLMPKQHIPSFLACFPLPKYHSKPTLGSHVPLNLG